MDDNEEKQPLKIEVKTDIGEGLGCFLTAIGFAIVIWALSGFPGIN